MRCEEYLKRLGRGVAGLAGADEIVADLGEHFRSGMERGKTEEELCAALQSPESLAREYRAQELARNSGESPGFLRSLNLLGRAASAGLADGRSRLLRLAVGVFGGMGLLAAALFGALAAVRLGVGASADRALIGAPPPPALYILAALAFCGGGLAVLLASLAALRRFGRETRSALLDRSPSSGSKLP